MSVAENLPSAAATGDDLAPRGPWSFLAAACRGGGSHWGLQLMAGWLAFSLLTSVFWALHLMSLTGWSSLPNYWGELLTFRDLWELVENGGLRYQWTGAWLPLAAGLAFLWVLWAGWRLQAAALGRPARFGAWLWGAVDAALIGAVPLALLAGLAWWVLGRLGGTGIQGLGWLDWIGGGLVKLAFISALFLQWWLCRMARAAAPAGWRLGGWRRLAGHLGLGFRRFWRHPVQWFSLILGGVLLRSGLTLLVLWLAWWWGGGTVLKVGLFLGLQLLVVVVNAWLLGWFLRVAALFLRHDAKVQAAIRDLRAAAQAGGGSEPDDRTIG